MKKYLWPLYLLISPILIHSAAWQEDDDSFSNTSNEVIKDQVAEVDKKNYGEKKSQASTKRWRKDPQGREAYLQGTEQHKRYQEETRINSGRNVGDDSLNSDWNNSPRSNPRWYKDSEARKAYLNNEKHYNRPN